MSEKERRKRLELIRLKLLVSQPYYSLVLQKCVINWTKEVQTAGVRVLRDGQIELAISPDFFDKLSDEHNIGLLMHEMLHLFMEHLKRGEKYPEKQISNIAMDCAINQFIPEKLLPDGACLPKHFEGSNKQPLPDGKSYEYYYHELMKNAKQQKVSGSGSIDNHEWNKKNGEQGQTKPGETLGNMGGNVQIPKELADEIVKGLVKDTGREAKRGSQAGNIPRIIEEFIQEIAKSEVMNWRDALRKFIGRERSKQFESTRTKPNRRMGFMAQGVKWQYFPKIMVGIDQSGSISMQDCANFIQEIKTILKNADGNTEVVYFDTEIHKKIKISKASSIKNMRYASGGTNFNCVMEYAQKSKPDLVIMLTDGCAPAPKKIRVPVLWGILRGYSHDHLSGIKVEIKD